MQGRCPKHNNRRKSTKLRAPEDGGAEPPQAPRAAARKPHAELAGSREAVSVLAGQTPGTAEPSAVKVTME